MATLRVEEVTVRFGGLMALDRVSLVAPHGKIMALIGPNGSGKSTLLNAVSGYVPTTSGSIWLDDDRLDRVPAHKRAARGLARAFQGGATLGELSPVDNVLVGSHRGDPHSFWKACVPSLHSRLTKSELQFAREALRSVGVDPSRARDASTLSYGEKRLVDIARAVALSGGIILLDEPAAGLNQFEVTQLRQLVLSIQEAGVTVLLVEHHMGLVMSLCEHILVLNFGRKIAEGPPGDVRRDPRVIEAYLGRSDSA